MIMKYKHLCIFLLFLSSVSCKPQKKEHSEVHKNKPNVLLIMVDDLNDWTGHLGGHPQTITPNIDQLAARGLSFTNAHTNAPLCGPSRASMLTGLKPSTSGVYFHIEDPDLVRQVRNDSISATLLPDYFEQNGYVTFAVGKIFHKGDKGEAFDEYGGLSNFGPWSDKRFKYDPTWFEKPKGTSTDWGAFPEHDSLTYDARIADWAIEKLSDRHEKPFFLAAGFMRPHVPWYVPQKWFDRFNLDSIKTPPYAADDWKDIPKVAALMTNWPMMPEMGWMLKSGNWEGAVRAYLASVHFVDHQIGRLLNALKNSPYADNTIVVLASDHGYHMGEKGLFQKGTLWKRSTRIPMIWAGKGIQKGATQTASSLIDIYPTLIDYCGLPKLNYLEGKSIQPLFSRDAKNFENVAITTFGKNNHSIYDTDWHYIFYNNGSEELYNLSKDPNEWENLASVDSLQAIKQRLRSMLPKKNAANNPHSEFSAAPYFNSHMNNNPEHSKSK